MKTLNVNETKMVNNSVESNNATMGNVEELTKVLKQEEKELQRLIKRNADEAVIAAQQNVVDKTKAKLEQAQEFEIYGSRTSEGDTFEKISDILNSQ